MKRRILLAGLAGAVAARSGLAVAQSAPLSVAPSQNDNTLGIIAGGLDGTYIRFADDLAAVLDGIDGLRLLPIIGKGSMQNLADLLGLQRVDLAFVQSDVLAAAAQQRLFSGLQQEVQYIAKLYDEEVHIFARAGVKSLADLAGKRVNMESRSSGTAMTTNFLLSRFGIAVQPVYVPSNDATELLRKGELDALVRIAGKPTRFSAPLPEGTHLLPIPLNEMLMETYSPATLTAEDYPALIPAGGSVETVAVGAVLACYNHQSAARRDRLQRFSRALTLKFDSFLQPPRHPKWRDVNLTASLPGWTRFGQPLPASTPPAQSRPRNRSGQRLRRPFPSPERTEE